MTPEELKARMAGAGMDEIDTGVSAPIIKILQSRSAEVDEDHPDHEKKKIEGAKAGCIVFNETGQILQQPVEMLVLGMRTIYAEWRPKRLGGGMAAHHPLSITTHPDYEKGRNPERPYQEFLGENELNLTMYFTVLFELDGIHREALIPMTGSNLAIARAWAKMISRFRYPDNQTQPATFSRSYLLSTKKEVKESNTYYSFQVQTGRVLSFEGDEADLLGMALDAQQVANQKMLPAPGPTGQQAALPGSVASDDTDEDKPF